MREYRFSKIYDYALVQEYYGQRKPVFWHILCSVAITSPCINASLRPDVYLGPLKQLWWNFVKIVVFSR